MFCNLNLQINTVGFYQVQSCSLTRGDCVPSIIALTAHQIYRFKLHGSPGLQITKIAVAPAVLLIEFLLFRKSASPRIVAAIALVCAGVGLSTLTDVKVGTSGQGLAVGAAAVGATALYQVLRHLPLGTPSQARHVVM